MKKKDYSSLLSDGSSCDSFLFFRMLYLPVSISSHNFFLSYDSGKYSSNCSRTLNDCSLSSSSANIGPSIENLARKSSFQSFLPLLSLFFFQLLISVFITIANPQIITIELIVSKIPRNRYDIIVSTFSSSTTSVIIIAAHISREIIVKITKNTFTSVVYHLQFSEYVFLISFTILSSILILK